MARGRALVNGRELRGGDGAFIEDEAKIRILGDPEADVLVADLR